VTTVRSGVCRSALIQSGFREVGLAGDDGAHGLEGYFLKQTVYVRY
jgi:hypothetical protein